ncbi:hypothetical protein GCM10008171_15810 [Methylopila jiangsuensis]|uniref:Flagellar hook-length control protein-like C-terminal domain-containing protein n=1 Tax=Methylopila jiangsuensis TaxID=586230 RepID=A0A9W6JFX8_9HYPH|nr:flagellar hook-length control protein FliK [Methylopila jiangsuensis]MDR6284156.1 hypothetical protein [Methylopila jiangsuensis]GLK76327.1 hypothetical protein GCM10008171_15810 [Methylopila jiangsuensis]
MTPSVAPAPAPQPSPAPTSRPQTEADDSFARALEEADQTAEKNRVDAQGLTTALADVATALIAAPQPVRTPDETGADPAAAATREPAGKGVAGAPTPSRAASALQNAEAVPESEPTAADAATTLKIVGQSLEESAAAPEAASPTPPKSAPLGPDGPRMPAPVAAVLPQDIAAPDGQAEGADGDGEPSKPEVARAASASTQVDRDADAGADGGSDAAPDGGDGPARTADAARASGPAGAFDAALHGRGASTAAGASAAQTAAAVVAAAIAAPSGSGARRTRFDVELEDGDLGRVDVRLDIAADGRVSTRLMADRPETLTLLRQDADELARLLGQAGFQLGEGGLSFELRDGGAPWRDDGGRPASALTFEDVGDDGARLAAPLAYGARGAASAALDVTV